MTWEGFGDSLGTRRDRSGHQGATTSWMASGFRGMKSAFDQNTALSLVDQAPNGSTDKALLLSLSVCRNILRCTDLSVRTGASPLWSGRDEADHPLRRAPTESRLKGVLQKVHRK
jgi:hypothetical protein